MKVTRHSAILISIASSFILGAIFIECTNPILAQMPQQSGGSNQQLGMIFYPVERGQDGQQYIITRAGYKVAVPGLGIDPNASQISVFTDPQNHYWYVDKNNNPTPVSAQQMQSVMSQIQGQAMQRGQTQYNQYPQGMPPQGMYPQNYNPAPVAAAAAPAAAAVPQQNSNNAGNTAMMSGLAAAGGAAMGSMITNSMYNNNNQYPYGQPIYKEPTGQYYYANQSGAHVPVYPPASSSTMYNQQAASGYYQQQQQQQQQNKEAAAGYYGKQQQQQQANKEAAAGYAKQQQTSPTGAAAGAAQEKEGRFERRHKGEDSGQAGGAARATRATAGAQSRTRDGGRRRNVQQLNR